MSETTPTHYHTENVLAAIIKRLRDVTGPVARTSPFVVLTVLEGEIEELETLRAAHAIAAVPRAAEGLPPRSWDAEDQAALDGVNDGQPFSPNGVPKDES